ncbi:peptidase U32 family protein [Spirochaeta isovalerica]|uniref:Putative protease n=1 Tax=Spirochaeta isovalerica TaxID=150 RepID=A0A841RDB6_9SPIO|nr:DUF3656 domain-containing protein [Spirochaeta isovalerica]MBB6482025.1 putative protease [Spirochaeta isovalerica]
MKKPEILAPGGGFNSALHAYEAGADAVYAGMSAFSARKGAVNFTNDQLRRLKSYAVEHNKKIYIAINTVLKQQELEQIIILLHSLSDIQIDGIILQDPGLAYILEKYFPAMERHASTQMAVHNSQGVSALKDAGFKRIILSRELSLSEIEKIRRDHEDVELEVFIHGAMCYSFSGICLASGRLLGRSGNRGECGQICRTWFDGEKGHSFSFSANDMKGGEAVIELTQMGIDSLKIEGRLKSPEYVSHTVRYYRDLLDRNDRSAIRKEEDLSAIAFSREQTAAFFNNRKGENMVGNLYPGHRGISAGHVLSSGKGIFHLKSRIPLSDRDGLLLFLKNEPQQFALKSPGKKHSFKSGESVPVLFNRSVSPGTEIYLVSRHDMTLKEYREESYKPWKTPVPLKVEMSDSKLVIKAALSGQEFTYEEEVEIQESTGGKDFREILTESFSKSGESDFRLSSLELTNLSDLGDREIFLPLSRLKKIRQNFFKNLDMRASQIYRESASRKTGDIDAEYTGNPFAVFPGSIPGRQSMSPSPSPVPFGPGEDNFFPVPPLQFSDSDFEKIRETVDRMLEITAGPVVLGLNNPGHLSLVKEYGQNERVYFFTDYCTYTANKAAVLFYRTRIKRLIYSTYWIEDKEGQLPPLFKLDSSFNPHLFLSRICYRLHNDFGTCRDCRKDYHYSLNQRDREFTVVVKNCLTWLFQKR